MKIQLIIFALLSLSFMNAQSFNVSEELDINFVNDTPRVSVEVNGKIHSFLLDTGASKSVVFVEGKKRMGFKTKRLAEQFEGVGGPTNSYKIYGLAINDRHGNILHDSFKGVRSFGLNRTLGVSGILGGDFFRKGWLIDYENQKLIKLKTPAVSRLYKRENSRVNKDLAFSIPTNSKLA